MKETRNSLKMVSPFFTKDSKEKANQDTNSQFIILDTISTLGQKSFFEIMVFIIFNAWQPLNHVLLDCAGVLTTLFE